jgi:hypothetical protein
MLRLTTLVALAIAAAQPAIAAPAMEHGRADGQRFEYTSELRANGVIHIEGVVLASREPFALDVTRNGHVDGVFGYTSVGFRISKTIRDREAARLGEVQTLASADLRD